MVIALDNSYKEMTEKLKQYGYTVVGLESSEKVDAVLYNSKYENEFLDNINNTNMISSTNNAGVLLVDIKGKNVGQIDEMLKKRLYTPLF